MQLPLLQIARDGDPAFCIVALAERSEAQDVGFVEAVPEGSLPRARSPTHSSTRGGTSIQRPGFATIAPATTMLSECFARVKPKNRADKIKIPYGEIAALAFTGKDTAAGKSFDAWVKKYWEKKAAGERNIGIDAESLDDE